MKSSDAPPAGLGALLAARGFTASNQAAPEPARSAPPGWSLATPAKVVVRVQRKGHGGKTVTAVEGLAGASEGDLDDLCKQLKKAMGSGARVEDGAVVVQGDLRERLVPWLTQRGARKIVG